MITPESALRVPAYDFVTDEAFFSDLNPKGESWNASNAIFKGIDGSTLTEAEQEIWQTITSLPYVVGSIARNILWLIGRRGAKTINTSRLAIKEAFTFNGKLVGGEKAHVLVVSPTVRTSGTLMRHIRHYIQASPILKQAVIYENQHEIHLDNGVVIAVYPASKVSGRGLSTYVLILEETSFFRTQGVVTDVEVFRAVRPGMATFPDSRFYILSTPYIKEGLVYDLYKRYYGVPNDYVLVCQAPTSLMNPTISKEFLEQEREADPEYYLREYEAQFTDSISSAFTREAGEACVVSGRYELPYSSQFKYSAGVDPAGGGKDEFTMSITHQESDSRIVQDCLRAAIASKPAELVAEMAKTLQQYRISRVIGDKYSGEWVREAFRRHGIDYQVSQLTTSEAYLELLPVVNQGNIELLDDKKQTMQLITLERTKGKSGKDTIGHPKGANFHDDRATSLALSVYASKNVRKTPGIYF